MPRFNKRAVWVALAFLPLAGCFDVNHTYYDHMVSEHYARREAITTHGPDAVATNLALQVRDPWPAVSANRNLPMNGAVAASAIERYRTGKVIPPRGIGTSSVSSYGQTPSGQSGAASGPSGASGNP